MKFLAAHGVEFRCDSRKAPGLVGILNLSADSFSGDGKMDMKDRFAAILVNSPATSIAKPATARAPSPARSRRCVPPVRARAR